MRDKEELGGGGGKGNVGQGKILIMLMYPPCRLKPCQLRTLKY